MLLRKAWIISTSFRRKPIRSIDESFEHHFRVLPSDIDENFHLNNARYLSFTELARYDWMSRTGLLRYAVKNKISAVVANAAVLFRREIKPFQAFILQSKVLSWTDQTAFIEHRFLSGEKTLAVVVVEVRLLMKGGRVSFSQIARELGLSSHNSFNKTNSFLQSYDSVVKALLKDDLHQI